MITERVTRIREWVRQDREWRQEFRRFSQFFPHYMEPNGLLTKPEEEIDPLLRGFYTAKGSFGLMRKAIKEKGLLTEEERTRVREAAWLNSLSGTYEIGGAENCLEVKVSLDRGDALSYLLVNIAEEGTTVAFLNTLCEKSTRYREATGLRVEENSVTFSFPKVDMGDGKPDLYVYTVPAQKENIKRELSRMRLILWRKP